MKRRSFIVLTGISAAMCVIPPSLYFIAPGVRQYATLILKKELFYLKLAPGAVEKYVEDYFNSTGNDMVSTIKWKILYYMKSGWKNADRIELLIRYFLLSSDFFINKCDESVEVYYLGFFNSYKSPIPNPYSFVLYPPDTIKDA